MAGLKQCIKLQKVIEQIQRLGKHNILNQNQINTRWLCMLCRLDQTGRPALTETNLIWKLYLEYHKPVLVWIVLWGTTN